MELFVYAVDLPANVTTVKDVYVGMPMTFHTSGLVPGINTTSDEKITYLEPQDNPPFAAWRFNPGSLAEVAIQTEHVNVLYDVGGGKTRYVSWETYYGVVSVVVATLEGNLKAEFVQQGIDLKKRVESLQGRR